MLNWQIPARRPSRPTRLLKRAPFSGPLYPLATLFLLGVCPWCSGGGASLAPPATKCSLLVLFLTMMIPYLEPAWAEVNTNTH